MDAERIRAAILAHRRLIRLYRNPGRDALGEWQVVMADLAEAARHFAGLEYLTADEALDYRRVEAALRR